MKIYTVHEPPPRRDGDPGDIHRVVFVRDGFHVWAFLLGPLWMLWRRLWLVLLLYILVMVLLQAGLWALQVGSGVRLAVGLLISLLVGMEASTLWRWTYARRGWRYHGVVAAPDLESAERRFFDGHVSRDRPAATDTSSPAHPVPPASTDVIGLFPEPDVRR